MNAPTRPGMTAEINVTPLVDIMLVLLIVFMIAQPALRMGYASAIPAPGPAESVAQGPQAALLRVESAGAGAPPRLLLDGEPLTAEELPGRLTVLRATGRPPMVFLDGDEKVNFEALMQVADTVRASGMQLGFATDPVSR